MLKIVSIVNKQGLSVGGLLTGKVGMGQVPPLWDLGRLKFFNHSQSKQSKIIFGGIIRIKPF